MNIKVSLEKELRIERQRRLALQAENEEVEDLLLDKLLESDFRQSLAEMGVDVNELNL